MIERWNAPSFVLMFQRAVEQAGRGVDLGTQTRTDTAREQGDADVSAMLGTTTKTAAREERDQDISNTGHEAFPRPRYRTRSHEQR
jgi:hypothetical protein